jgi:hypothetical protein
LLHDVRRTDGSRRISADNRPRPRCRHHFLDTANVYSIGLSEEVVGALKVDGKRREIVSPQRSIKMGEGVND